MDYIFATGVVGSLILLTGAAWPSKKVKHPALATKNWIFTVGNVTMFTYAILNYLNGGPVFFIFLQILVAVSTIMMMLNVKDKIDIPIIGVFGLGMVIWSLYLFQGYNTILFVLGLTGVGIGYTLETGSLKRSIALTLGSILIAVFSYLEASWIFFWLNSFFALFSAYYVVKGIIKK